MVGRHGRPSGADATSGLGYRFSRFAARQPPPPRGHVSVRFNRLSSLEKDWLDGGDASGSNSPRSLVKVLFTTDSTTLWIHPRGEAEAEALNQSCLMKQSQRIFAPKLLVFRGEATKQDKLRPRRPQREPCCCCSSSQQRRKSRFKKKKKTSYTSHQTSTSAPTSRARRCDMQRRTTA